MLQQSSLFVRGTDGYHTYRIPALVVSTRGTLLAFCEGRRNSGADHGDIDLLLRRSFDGGVTWQDVQTLCTAGDNTAGNPAPVVDTTKGRIHLAFCINNKTVWVMESADDGASWTDPREITGSVKLPDWSWYGTGPCHGIQLSTGRLVIPCYQHRQAHVIYSDDHGVTWQRGGVVGDPAGESVVLESADGSVYINSRNPEDLPQTHRAFAWSRNHGDSFAPTQWDAALVEPYCQASVVRLTTQQQHGKNRILFSNPASLKREMMTIKMSYDECRSWEVAKTLYEGPSAYSDLCVLPDMTICCLYERGLQRPYETLTLARFDIQWLTDSQDGIL